METMQEEKLRRAKKRLEEIKGFYIHLIVYLLVNGFITISNLIHLDEGESFWHFGIFITPVFWGIGLLMHGLYTFNAHPFMGKKWEERKIRKFMEEDRNEANKFK